LKTLVIIPTYNEVENIERLVAALASARAAVPGGFDLLFVDDNSPDGTALKIKDIAARLNPMGINMLERAGKAGLASAYIDGFRWGMARGYDLLIEMDADLSHDPACLPAMVGAAESNDFVVCSRYVKQGGVEGWGLLRKLISRGGSLFSQVVLACPLRDLTGGYNAWKSATLEKIGLGNLISQGYSFQIELKYRAFKSGASFAEIPFVFKDRQLGKSKMSKAIFAEAFKNVLKLRWAVK
jgi:dolichol-phosphate mannosyltransferase